MNYCMDRVRVYFADGSDTVIFVLEDESIISAICSLCEQEGWDLFDVTNYFVEGKDVE